MEVMEESMDHDIDSYPRSVDMEPVENPPTASENPPELSENARIFRKNKPPRVDINQNIIRRTCDFCDREAKFACSRCESSWSCSELHGSYHQLRKTQSCSPVKICFSPGVGRYVVAARDIQAGEIISVEEPLVVGPNQESEPICLGCLAEVDTSYLCSRCGYPMCDEDCSNSPEHVQECSILSRAPKPDFSQSSYFNTTAYHCILPLRVLLTEDVHKSELIHQFMDHREDRIDNEYWKTSQELVVDFLRNKCGLTAVSEAELHHIVGLLEVNSFEIHSYGNAGYRGMFAVGSLLSHSCRPNAKLIFGKEPPFTSRLLARVDIPAGSELVTSYLDTLTSTLQRRHLLRTGWYFDCCCDRCKDPTELGTHLNTVTCQQCRLHNKTSFLLPDDTENQDSGWTCRICTAVTDGKELKSLVEKFENEISTMSQSRRYDFEAWLELRENAKQLFHPSHQILQDISRWTIPIIRPPNQDYSVVPNQIVQEKFFMTQSYLEVLNKVEPGITRNRGKTTFELAEIFLHILTTKLQSGVILRSNEKSFESLDFFLNKPISTETALGICKDLLTKLDEIIFIFSILGTSSPFEAYILSLTEQMPARVKEIEKAIVKIHQ